jgi:hypothetical protein
MWRALFLNELSLACILALLVWVAKPPLAKITIGVVGCLMFFPAVVLGVWSALAAAEVRLPALAGTILATVPASVAVFAVYEGLSRLKRERLFLEAAIAASREAKEIEAAHLCRRFDVVDRRGAALIAQARRRGDISPDTQVL